MPSLQGHGTQKNSSIHASVLIYVQYIVHVLVELSRFGLLFWLSILFVHVNFVSRLRCAQYCCFA